MRRGRIDPRALRRTPPLDDPRALCDVLGLGTEPRDRQRQGAGLIVRCPKHNGVSLSVTRGADGTTRIRCFGGCGLAGDALTLIAAARGLTSFRDTLDEAIRLTGGAIHAPERTEKQPRTPNLNAESYDRIAASLLELCPPLREQRDVAAYLDRRGLLDDAETVGLVGLPHDHRRGIIEPLLATFERSDLELASILKPGEDVIPWRMHSLVIPWRDRFGRVVCLQRRRVRDGDPKYISPFGRAPRAPFGIDRLAAALERTPSAEIIFVEGALDALARKRLARTAGEVAIVLGVYSASTPTAGLPLDLLGGRSIVLALDVDAEGEAACAKLVAALRSVARSLCRERPAENAKDWGDLLARRVVS